MAQVEDFVFYGRVTIPSRAQDKNKLQAFG